MESLMLTMPFSEAVREIIKIMIVYRRHQHDTRALDYFVLKGWFANRPLLPPILINPYPLNWRGNISVGAKPLVQVTEVFVKVLGVHFCRYLVHTWSHILASTSISLPQKVTIDQMVQVVEYHFGIAFSLFCNSL